MPPPPPQAFESKQAAIDGAKAFAKQNQYVLVVGHSYKDKVRTDMLFYMNSSRRARKMFPDPCKDLATRDIYINS